MTKEQALCRFHNAVGLAITEYLCEGNVRRKDILQYDLWSPEQIAETVEDILAKTAEKNSQ